MTDAPTNRGVLTDKEGAGFPGCRILVDGEQQDRSFVVLSFVQKYLDAIQKKARVCFTTKDGKNLLLTVTCYTLTRANLSQTHAIRGMITKFVT